MKVNVICGAQHAYACIKGDTFSMDVQLAHGKGPAQSLRESAVEIDTRIERLVKQAQRLRHAAQLLEFQS